MRGMSHIEMVLAFLLFLGAVMFSLIFLQNSKHVQTTTYESDSVVRSIVHNITVPAIFQTIVFNTSTTNQIIALPFSSVMPVVVVNVSGASLLGSYNDGLLTINRKDGGRVATIVASSGVETGAQALQGVADARAYTLGVSQERTLPAVLMIVGLARSYQDAYLETKTALGIPSGTEFGFTLHNETGILIGAQRAIPAGVSIVNKKERMEFLLPNGRTSFLELEVQAW